MRVGFRLDVKSKRAERIGGHGADAGDLHLGHGAAEQPVQAVRRLTAGDGNPIDLAGTREFQNTLIHFRNIAVRVANDLVHVRARLAQ